MGRECEGSIAIDCAPLGVRFHFLIGWELCDLLALQSRAGGRGDVGLGGCLMRSGVRMAGATNSQVGAALEGRRRAAPQGHSTRPHAAAQLVIRSRGRKEGPR